MDSRLIPAILIDALALAGIGAPAPGGKGGSTGGQNTTQPQ